MTVPIEQKESFTGSSSKNLFSMFCERCEEWTFHGFAYKELSGKRMVEIWRCLTKECGKLRSW